MFIIFILAMPGYLTYLTAYPFLPKEHIWKKRKLFSPVAWAKGSTNLTLQFGAIMYYMFMWLFFILLFIATTEPK